MLHPCTGWPTRDMTERCAQSLPLLYAVGTHYDVGYSVGKTFADKIKSFWRESADVNNIDLPFYNTPAGKEYFKKALEICKKNFPQFVRELEGIADGAQMSFDNIFMLNLSKEVHNVLAQQPVDKQFKEVAGCTDIFINRPTCKILGHNEDCDPKIKPFGYLVSFQILQDNLEEEEETFTAYCYPGVLPGTAFSFNRHGMVFSVNGLYPDFISETSPPRMFINRSMIKARSLNEAIELIKNPGFGVAYGFTLNIADIRHPSDMWSVEVAPHANESLFHVYTVAEEKDPGRPCHYIHINNYKHLKIAEKPNLRSTKARTIRTEEFPPPENRQNVLTILGDEGNQEFPIYRSERPSDHSATSFTAVVDIIKNRVDIYTENPAKSGVKPLLCLNIMEKNEA
ncbi:unnamed protein product [Lymnaea stagnalis]|uniref:Peptidase C45 hydrolase domain-containing protein n=1 Tax=Lymnaea stagnalis TaxID=6523 RepID=A0AAV2HFG2_LYMST